MKRYESEKLWSMGPVDGFIIHTPDDRQLIDTHPQTIVRELNRLNVEIDEKRKDIVYLATEKAKLEERIKRLEEAVEAYRTAYTPDGHVAPHDCFATGPKTGNPIEDLVACPGCWAERKAKEAKL